MCEIYEKRADKVQTNSDPFRRGNSHNVRVYVSYFTLYTIYVFFQVESKSVCVYVSIFTLRRASLPELPYLQTQ